MNRRLTQQTPDSLYTQLGHVYSLLVGAQGTAPNPRQGLSYSFDISTCIHGILPYLPAMKLQPLQLAVWLLAYSTLQTFAFVQPENTIGMGLVESQALFRLYLAT